MAGATENKLDIYNGVIYSVGDALSGMGLTIKEEEGLAKSIQILNVTAGEGAQDVFHKVCGGSLTAVLVGLGHIEEQIKAPIVVRFMGFDDGGGVMDGRINRKICMSLPIRRFAGRPTTSVNLPVPVKSDSGRPVLWKCSEYVGQSGTKICCDPMYLGPHLGFYNDAVLVTTNKVLERLVKQEILGGGITGSDAERFFVSSAELPRNWHKVVGLQGYLDEKGKLEPRVVAQVVESANGNGMSGNGSIRFDRPSGNGNNGNGQSTPRMRYQREILVLDKKFLKKGQKNNGRR